MSLRYLRHGLNICRRYQWSTRQIKYRNVTTNLGMVLPGQFLRKHENIYFAQRFSTAAEANNIHEKSKEENIMDFLKTRANDSKRIPFSAIQEYLRITEGVTEYQINETENLLYWASSCLPYKSPEVRQQLVEKIWSKRPGTFFEPLIISYLNACRMNKYNIDHKQYFNDNLSHPVLEGLLQVVCETGNMKGAEEILSKMLGRPFNESIICSLVRGYGFANNLNAVKAILDTMNIEMTEKIVSELIQVYLKNDKQEEAEALIDQNLTKLNPENKIQILLTALKSGSRDDLVKNIIQSFPDEILTVKEINSDFKHICSELIVDRKFDEMLKLIGFLPTPKFIEQNDLDRYAEFALHELLMATAPLEFILRFCQELGASGKNKFALRTITGQALKSNFYLTIDLLKALAKIEPLRPHYFWPILLQNHMVDGEVGILRTLKLMGEFNVEVDAETLGFYVLPSLGVTLKNVEKGVKLLDEAKVKISTLLTPLTISLLFQQRQNDVIFINSLYQSKLDTQALIHPLVSSFSLGKSRPNTVQTISKLIKLFRDKGEDQKYDVAGHFFVEVISSPKTKSEHTLIISLIGELSLLGVKISKLAADMLSRYLTEHLTEEQQKQYFHDFVDKKLVLPAQDMFEGHMKHPRDMSLDELKCHLTELESKNMNTRGILRKLLQLAVRENQLDFALKIKKKCDALNLEVSPGMQACIFDLYVKTKNIEEASKALRKLNHRFPGFLLDEYKIVDFAALLVEKGNINEAQRILRMRAGVAKVKNGDYLTKNIWNLLNNVATLAPTLDDSKNRNLTKEMFDFLYNIGYCGHYNAILGPVIKELLNKNNLKDAVVEFKSYNNEYRLTPLQRQLMTVLVDASNRPEIQQQYNVLESEAREMLQDVVKIAASTHGPASTNTTLIVALAEAGTEKQLRKVLIDPKNRINLEQLRKECDYMNSKDKLNALQKLGRCSRGLGHIQEQTIYNMMLDTLIKKNNCEQAITLFEQLISEDGFKINNEFIKNLVDLLKRNNLELPTSVALYAKQ